MQNKKKSRPINLPTTRKKKVMLTDLKRRKRKLMADLKNNKIANDLNNKIARIIAEK